MTTVAGNGIPEGYGSGDDGPATQAQLVHPRNVAAASDGSIYISDESDHRIRRVGPDGKINTFAGNGTAGFFGDRGLATAAQLNGPKGICVGPDQSLYIADSVNNRLRRVSPDGKINTIAGDGTAAFGGDGGPATSAQLRPSSVAVGQDGNVYIVDSGARIR